MEENKVCYDKNSYTPEEVEDRLKAIKEKRDYTHPNVICLSFYASFLKSNFDLQIQFVRDLSKKLNLSESLVLSRVQQGRRLSEKNCITAYELMTNPKYNLVVNGGGK